MNGAERARLREAVDAHTRDLILIAHGRRYCIECGGHHDEHTRDCQACHDRHQRRLNRKRGTST